MVWAKHFAMKHLWKMGQKVPKRRNNCCLVQINTGTSDFLWWVSVSSQTEATLHDSSQLNVCHKKTATSLQSEFYEFGDISAFLSVAYK